MSIFKDLDQPVQKLIREATQQIILPAFYEQIPQDKVFAKSDHSIVTTIDFEVQNFMQGQLQALLPGSGFLGEEETEWRTGDAQGEWVWIVDPIDGTHNFASQIDQFGTMVALWHLPTNRPIYGWIYLSVADLMFSGGLSQGVYCNDHSLLSITERLQKQLKEMTGLLNYGSFGPAKETMRANSHHFRTIDPSSCAAMKFAALLQDKADFAVFGRAKIWDLSAGFALLEELGGFAGKVTGLAMETPILSVDKPSQYAGWHLAVRQKENWPLVRDQLFENVEF